jgi:hypothetical protein
MAPTQLTGLEDFATNPAVIELADGTKLLGCIHQATSPVEESHAKLYRVSQAGVANLLWTNSLYGKDLFMALTMPPGKTVANVWLSEAAYVGAPGSSAAIDWYQVEVGIQQAGGSGAPGPKGDPGVPGPAGKTILNGPTPPGANVGTAGDFYLNTTTAQFYGPKTAAGWGNGVSLVGSGGTTGDPRLKGFLDGLAAAFKALLG